MGQGLNCCRAWACEEDLGFPRERGLVCDSAEAIESTSLDQLKVSTRSDIFVPAWTLRLSPEGTIFPWVEM